MAEIHLDEEAIFNIACRIDLADVRADYLQQVCSQDTVLLTRVEQLLVIHDQEREFLELPPSELRGRAITGEAARTETKLRTSMHNDREERPASQV